MNGADESDVQAVGLMRVVNCSNPVLVTAGMRWMGQETIDSMGVVQGAKALIT